MARLSESQRALILEHYELARMEAARARGWLNDPLSSSEVYSAAFFGLCWMPRVAGSDRNPGAFARMCARHQISADRARRRLETGRGLISYEPEKHDRPDRRDGPLDVLIARERIDGLYTAINDLPVVQRFILHLQLEGWSTREIGDELGVSHQAVEQRIAKAFASLRVRLGAGFDE